MPAEVIDRKLEAVPHGAQAFLRRLLEPDVAARPSAREALEDAYLASARDALVRPVNVLGPNEVLERFRHYGQSSMPVRAWLLAVARSPSRFAWEDYCVLRDTFKIFDSQDHSGNINVEAFLFIVAPAGSSPERVKQARDIWFTVCDNGESLSYNEFLSALLPTVDDDFKDVSDAIHDGDTSSDLEGFMAGAPWHPGLPVSHFFPQLPKHEPSMVFEEHVKVMDVLQAMSNAPTGHRFVIVNYRDGRQEFFDFMDVIHHVVKKSEGKGDAVVSALMEDLASMDVGAIANCSGFSAFVPVHADTPIRNVLKLIAGCAHGESRTVRRVPVVSSHGEVICVVSSTILLDVLMRYLEPIASLKSLSARRFDQRQTLFESSALHDGTLLEAFRVMDANNLTVTLATTSRDLSGGLGGVVSVGIISMVDIRWAIRLNEFFRLDKTVGEFISWRAGVVSCNEVRSHLSKKERPFNVVSVDANDSMHALARSMLASKLNRIFLWSKELNRIVGIVSSRDILIQVSTKIV
eukprot:TRINITY_DN22165_c0_g1_i4.p1 TRINITY_DN22165_c0_g1~~TRINITY_DN22165_c0_g1_i4.p1  ORF type:complete len:521 (-),score=79.33 TRINITY_DN22165_c0_g1_i4:50-1612(-)